MVRTAYARKLARRLWLRETAQVEGPSRTQTDTGDWAEGWATVYASARCYVEQAPALSPDQTSGGQIVTAVQTFLHFDPEAVTILPSYRVTVAGKRWQVQRVMNEDATDLGTLRVLVVEG